MLNMEISLLFDLSQRLKNQQKIVLLENVIITNKNGVALAGVPLVK